MLFRTAKLSMSCAAGLSARLPFFFCRKKLSHEAQSAIWAERVIHFILNAQPLTNIHSLSLTEQILKLQNPDSLHQFEPEPKEKVMRLFTSGVPLDSKVFDQDKLKSAKQTFLQTNTIDGNFVFCPNFLVTKQIFSIMMVKYSNFLVTGGFGISKTVAIILFIELSNHVNSYFFKAAQHQHKDINEELNYLKSVQVNPFFFDQSTKDKRMEHPELKLLKQKPYFFRTIPRYWYWSISSEKQGIQQQLRNILLLQAPQISQQRKNELRSIKDFKQFIRQLQRCYPYYKSYCMKVVVDQFNEVASLARQWNKKVDQYKKMPQETLNKEEYEQYEQKLRLPAQKYIQLVRTLTCLSNTPITSYVLCSQMSIQKELLDSYKGKQAAKVYFDIQNEHGDFKIKEIQYLLGMKKSFIDFLHNFWFEIERKLKIRDNDKAAIKEMKILFLDEVKDKQVNYCSRFLYVRQYLTQKKIEEIQKNYDQFKKDKSYNPFKGIYESFTEENTIKYKEQLRRYFETDKTKHSLQLFYALYDFALLQSYTADKDKELTVRLSDLAHRIGIDPLALLKLDKYKEVLPFSLTKDNKSIQFYWKPGQFASTTKDILFEILFKKQDYQHFSSFELLGFQKYSLLRDGKWKNCLTQSLQKGADVTFRQPKLQQLQELRFNIKQNRFTTFQSFNQFIITPKSQVGLDKRLSKKNKLKKQQAIAYIKKALYQNPKSEEYTKPIYDYQVHKIATASIGKNLKDLFTKCDQHPGEYCFATHREISNYEFIDFIIAKQQLGKYHIFTFDASIRRKKTKFEDAKTLFAELIQRQTGNLNYIINHVVLCHKDAIQQIPYDPNKTFNIFYSPWDEIAIRIATDPFALKSFYIMRDINNKMNDKLKKAQAIEE